MAAISTACLLAFSGPDAAVAWMADFPDDACLGSLAIPGTHNAAALHEPLPGTARCQDLGITAQLKAGVRYLDVRCRHVGDAFRIHHGPIDQQASFDEVIDKVAAFLTARPSEVILVCVKPEHREEANTRPFEATFRAHANRRPGLWWLGDRLPALGEARGRIVLVRRFPAQRPLGLDASDWPGNTTFSRGILRVQDRFRIDDIDVKWRDFVAHAKRSADAPPGVLFLNHASGVRSGFMGHPQVRRTATDLNRRLETHLAADPPPRTRGVTLVDFITPDLAAAILRTNNPHR